MTPVEAMARAMEPLLFDEDAAVRHRSASPLRVEVAQALAIKRTAIAYSAAIDALASNVTPEMVEAGCRAPDRSMDSGAAATATFLAMLAAAKGRR